MFLVAFLGASCCHCSSLDVAFIPRCPPKLQRVCALEIGGEVKKNRFEVKLFTVKLPLKRRQGGGKVVFIICFSGVGRGPIEYIYIYELYEVICCVVDHSYSRCINIRVDPLT